MKKLYLLGLIVLFSCTENSPLPKENNIEDLGISGGVLLPESGSELSLFISFQYLPKENNWDAVWIVNGVEIDRKSLSNSSKNRVDFTRFTPLDPGQYTFQGCIEFDGMTICKERTFTAK